MIDGMSGASLPAAFPYADLINALSEEHNVPPCLIGAIKLNETGLGHGPEAECCVSADGGHGLMQLTSSYPSDWQSPRSNVEYAIAHFIQHAIYFWATDKGMNGDDLVRCVAATYNAGLGRAEAGHIEGNVDHYTTNNYAARALAHYHNLVAGTVAD